MSSAKANHSKQGSPSETDALLASALLGIKGKPKTEEPRGLPCGGREQSVTYNEVSQTANEQHSFWPDFLNQNSAILLRMLDTARNSSNLLASSPQVRHFLHAETVSPHESTLFAARGNAASSFSLAQPSVSMGGQRGMYVSPTTAPGDATHGSPESTSAAAEAVRREQIQEALQSKPQRGKKRKNLTENERLELTRTRNREHARSTRNRKKARYDELLAKEDAYDKFQQQLFLDQARRQTVVDFLNVRQQMVRLLGRSPTSSPLPEGGITHIVDDLDSFVFYDGNGDTQEIKGLQGMGRFDEKLVSRTEDRFGFPATSLLTYSKSLERVALSLDNTASVDVELSIQGQSDLSLMSANLRVSFSAGSNKICSVEWRTMKDRFDEVPVDRLKVQKSYPSVVSFDPVTEGFQSAGTDGL